MPEPLRATRPTSASAAEQRRARAGSDPRQQRARRHPAPTRSRNRARVILSVLGLVVIIVMIIGLALTGPILQGARPTAPDDPLGGNTRGNLVPTYEARLRGHPDDLNTMLVLANILQNQGNYAEATTWYARAVELRPDDLEIRVAYGSALASYGQLYDAEAQYMRALALSPNDARTEFYLGNLYEHWTPPRPDEARAHYARASELQPEGNWGRSAREALNRLNATPVVATPTP